MVLIGIAGSIGSGKSTVAKYLTYLGYKEYYFAFVLKKACQILFDLTDEQIFGTQEEKAEPDPRWYNVSSRKILQYIGTDILRDSLNSCMDGIGEDYHVYRLGLELDKYDGDVCISDVRFLNEIEFIKKRGGYIINIDRILDKDENSHKSENSIPQDYPFDFTIDNNGTLDELNYQVKVICDKIAKLTLELSNF
jgi:hypothetical protein